MPSWGHIYDRGTNPGPLHGTLHTPANCLLHGSFRRLQRRRWQLYYRWDVHPLGLQSNRWLFGRSDWLRGRRRRSRSQRRIPTKADAGEL